MRAAGSLVDESFPHGSDVDACFVSRYKFFNVIQFEVEFGCIVDSHNPLGLVHSDDKLAFVHTARFDEVCDFRVEDLNHVAGQPNSVFLLLRQQKIF